ncbi:two-component sensor histidine kinase [Bradyrhizobium japonicum]|uniref:sensor histidine kinase n=1 Tax=Bradyrhizobium japonicum TaxID=375 RepID=UPI000693A49A|nr:sensor histidine kinase [Bradyrhizobium japonicum]MCW2224262.1 two-component sensor histidine kinase [Bradyrhizobium japonicum]MCW2339504.1 two-component sensor histidine kinase [Bradyrhizobium japonicum]
MRHTVTGSFRDRSGRAHYERIAPIRDDALENVVRELQHRMRNILSIVLCFVNNTDAKTTADFREALSARIATLSDAYKMIESAGEQRVSLAGMLERTLKPHAMFHRGRILLAGPDLTLEPHIALALHVIIHELATNASKYGALTSTAGAVDVIWESSPYLGGQGLAIQWRERGGPIVTKPERRGFGTQLIARALPGAQVDLDFAPNGLVCRILIDLGQTPTTQGPVS